MTAEDRKFPWYHLSLPLAGPHGILTDPQAVPGHPRLPLLKDKACSGKPLRKEFHTAFLTALHQPATLWKKRKRHVLIFIIVFTMLDSA